MNSPRSLIIHLALILGSWPCVTNVAQAKGLTNNLFFDLPLHEWAPLPQGDQVLSLYQRYLEMDIRDVDVDEKEIEHLRLVLKFENGAEILLPTRFVPKSNKKKIYASLTQKEALSQILSKHPDQLADLKLKLRDQEVEGPQIRILIGNPDAARECRQNPVLITDFHGTLQAPTDPTASCVRRGIQDLTQAGVMLVIMSTGGAMVKDELDNLGLDANTRSRILVLDRNSDKADTVARQLYGSGQCLIGFVGDTLATDGIAATELSLPLFYVHHKELGAKSFAIDAYYPPGSMYFANWCQLSRHILNSSQPPEVNP